MIEGVQLGQETGEDELVTLFSARGPEVAAVAALADELRRQATGETVTFVRTRNINYTNLCTFKCQFCAFAKGPLSLNLRGTPYLLTDEEIVGRAREAHATRARPRSVCRAASIRASTATPTSGSPAPSPSRCPSCTSTASPRSRSPRARAGWASRWRTT